MAPSLASSEPARRRRRRRSAQAHVMAEINITPMVDIMLVLLIIFMVAAPLMTVGVPIDLPDTAATPLPGEQEEEPLSITMTADGRLMIQTTEVAPDRLIGRLRGIMQERRSRRLYLRADGSIPYERLMQLMGALNAAGFREIGLVTDSIARRPGAPAEDGAAAPAGGAEAGPSGAPAAPAAPAGGSGN